MYEKKAQYLNVLILTHELEHYFIKKNYLDPYLFFSHVDCSLFFRELNFNILTINKFVEFVRKYQKNIPKNIEFNTIHQKLTNEYQFIKHLRNKISGHLDKILLEKAAQWEPTVFFNTINKNTQITLAYKTLFESAINSYIDDEGRHKIFDSEIDLFYPENNVLFLDTIHNINEQSLKLLLIIKKSLESDIEFITNKNQLFENERRAGETDFNIKLNNT